MGRRQIEAGLTQRPTCEAIDIVIEQDCSFKRFLDVRCRRSSTTVGYGGVASETTQQFSLVEPSVTAQVARTRRPHAFIRVREQEPVYTHASFTKLTYHENSREDRQALVSGHELLQHLVASPQFLRLEMSASNSSSFSCSFPFPSLVFRPCLF